MCRTTGSLTDFLSSILRASSVTTSASASEDTVVTFTPSFPRVSSTVQSNPTESAVPFIEDQPVTTPQTSTSGTDPSVTHMTVGIRNNNKSGAPGEMESRYYTNVDLFPFIQTCGDQHCAPDVLDTIYASSPNSLYMYDQEKIDMQCSALSDVQNMACAGSNSVAQHPDDFELKTQYEISQDLSLPSLTTGEAIIPASSTLFSDSGGESWGGTVKNTNENMMINHNKSKGSPDPTLAELNSTTEISTNSLDLMLDDINSYIKTDLYSIYPDTRTDQSFGKEEQYTKTTVKEEPVYTKLDNYNFAAQIAHNKMNNLASLKNNNKQSTSSHVTLASLIKTEPEDFQTGCQKTYTTLFKSASASDMDQSSMQLLSQLYAQRRQSTDDSKATSTLQRLLLNKPQHLPVLATQVKVEEPMKSPSDTRRIRHSSGGRSRKRSGTQAGLGTPGNTMDAKWEEIKQFIYDPSQLETQQTLQPQQVKRERQRYDSTSSVMTLTSNEDLESYQDDSDSDRDDDFSDSDCEGGQDLSCLDPADSLVSKSSKEKQYFWQYNVQSKGPKGTRVHFDMEEDPHALHDFEDPVFDPKKNNLASMGVTVKHGGKARKGDGNNIVPNPRKLCQIGLKLRKISKQINDFTPVSELPTHARSQTKKEKNKLASRACRLKKKAQHEAHKVKLHGLELEHRMLLKVLTVIRQELVERLQREDRENMPQLSKRLEQLIKENLDFMIAGHTTDYVNKVVRAVEAGNPTGGIEIRASRSYPEELHN